MLLNVECSAQVLAEIEHAFKFNDAVLRHLVVRLKKAATEPSPMMKEVQREQERKSSAIVKDDIDDLDLLDSDDE